jgi:hypothetical protein
MIDPGRGCEPGTQAALWQILRPFGKFGKNDSGEVNAPKVFMPTLVEPLAERGYYVFPLYATEMLLREQGLAEAAQIHQLPPPRLFDLFGADAALYITIKNMSAKYVVVYSSVVVDVEYLLKDTRTGAVLWESKQRHSDRSLAVLPLDIVLNALNLLAVTTLDYVRIANYAAFLDSDSLRVGPYHPHYVKREGAR